MCKSACVRVRRGDPVRKSKGDQRRVRKNRKFTSDTGTRSLTRIEKSKLKIKMSMSSVETVVEQLKTMSLMEATSLVAEIERVFNVDASAPVAGAEPSAVPAAEAPAAEEKSSFDVTLDSVPAEKRVAVLKVIRKLTSLGLADAKAFTTSLPKALKEGVDKAEAEEAKAALEEAGATVSLT